MPYSRNLDNLRYWPYLDMIKVEDRMLTGIGEVHPVLVTIETNHSPPAYMRLMALSMAF
jgi:hypothetical protein